MAKEIKYIVNGRYVDALGNDLGEVKGAEREVQQDGTTEVPAEDTEETPAKPTRRKAAE